MTHTELSLAASEQRRRADTSIGALLLEAGKISPDNAERVLRMQKDLGIRYGEAARRLGLIDEADILQVLARQFDYPYLQPGEGSLSPHLVAAYAPFSAQVEVLRAVRSQLMLRWFARGHKALAVAGVERGAGASLFAANLALVMAQLGQRTLLVDANLRKPSQHAIFNAGARQGLSDILAGRADPDLIEPVERFADLDLLGAGTLPPNPQELLARPSFAALNAKMEARYAITLYDVAASASGLDALIVAARCGGALIVARKNKTRLADIGSVAGQIAGNGGKVVGSVLLEFA